MRVCITGATGFLGGALLRRFLDENYHVTILARTGAKALALSDCGVHIVTGDLANADALKRAVERADFVFHAAAKVASGGTKQDFFEANVHGTETVLHACRAASVGRLVYISSLAVYGPIQAGQRIDENTPLDPFSQKRDFYAHSKIEADHLAADFARRTGLPVTIVRPGIIFGPGRALPIGLLGFRLGGRPFVFGKAQNRIPLNYIENLVDAIQASALRSTQTLEQFNVVDDDDLTLEQYHAARGSLEKKPAIFLPAWPVQLGSLLAAALAPALPPAKEVSSYQVGRALQNRWYSSDRIRRQAQWQPEISLRTAIERSLNAPS